MRCLPLFCLLLAMPGANALVLLTEDYPPFNMLEDGRVSGISTQILREAVNRAGLPAQFDLLPWARSLALAASRSDTCVYSAVRSAKRESQFKWIGPLVDDKIALFARTGSAIRLDSVADAKQYKVGGYLADAYGDYVERQGVPLDRAPADRHNLPKLMGGRIDLWVAGVISGAYKANREGYQGEVRVVITMGNPGDTQMWLACNPSMPDALFQKLDNAVQSVLQDGTAAGFAARYR
ncbi:transporter substrate-binding domain-containing protein [Chitinimonas viridis]|uniref:Transporter substrate-binding domain-containing protein n=1 Tax=Chitinimonas viridis TaxID=664880 RepID=A0ABT8B7B3_9NEIS|nr:transporter substrate-binding domain-containing protein [Chitinimonas viridis]MDN3577720.1 transporter substrate-binding domain-containing protein [Chitinimonas viridis]